jgi:polygalacturonase
LSDSTDIKITGHGTVDGKGYWWWMREFAVANKFSRPHLLAMKRVRNCVIEGVTWLNSPMFHMQLDDIDNFLI